VARILNFDLLSAIGISSFSGHPIHHTMLFFFSRQSANAIHNTLKTHIVTDGKNTINNNAAYNHVSLGHRSLQDYNASGNPQTLP
jgi:hypothetical protein